MDKHFPHILEPYHMKDIIDIHPEVTPEQRRSIWEKGYTIGMTKVNGKIIQSPGVGRSCSGHGMKVTQTSNELLRWLYQVSQQFDKRFDEICKEFGFDPSVTKFGLRFGPKYLEVFDKYTNSKSILTFPELFTFPD
jgi:hypothetical protein